MTDTLEFTGERFTPECEREIWYEHMHRYAFAASLCQGMRVLDAACGEGYGSAMLADSGADVTGLDLSEAAIGHALQRYGGQSRLTFATGDCTALPFDADRFDVVVSFETLEHLAEQARVLAEFRRVLRPGGFLLISSPDKAEYSDARGFNNQFHVRELYRDELETLLREHFPAVRLLGQKLMFHSVLFDSEDIQSVTLQQLSPEGLDSAPRIRQAPMYFVAACAETEADLPPLRGGLWLFDDDAASVYEHYTGEIRRNMAAGGIIAERDREIAELKQALAAANTPHLAWWRRLLGRG